MANYNFESRNFPGLFIRHSNFEGQLSKKGRPMDDFAFALVNRGTSKVAFRSVNFPDRYLRHRDFDLWVEAPPDPANAQFHADATFYRRPAPVRID